jgi:hypothetical protein
MQCDKAIAFGTLLLPMRFPARILRSMSKPFLRCDPAWQGFLSAIYFINIIVVLGPSRERWLATLDFKHDW